MAFPQVVARTETPVTTATDPTINFTQTTGDLVVVFLSIATAQTITVSDSFTNLTNTNATFHVIYKILTGSEGGTVDITLATNSKAAAVAYNIQNFNSIRTPELSTVATATSTGPDATTCTPTGGAKDYLWITAFGQAGEEADDDTWVTGTPTNFSNLTQTTSGTAGAATTNTQMASAERTVNASSLDAAAFTTAQSLVWRAYTLAVHPVFVSHAQAQADIKQTYTDKSGQSQADIKQTYTDKSGQPQADIKQTYTDKSGQTQADIKNTYFGLAQCQADIKAVNNGFGQTQADIKQTYTDKSGQSQADIKATYWGLGQAQGIVAVITVSGQTQGVTGKTDNLYTAIDEGVPDDTDYVTPYLPLGAYTARFGLSPAFTPDFHVNYVIRVRALGTLPSSTLTVKLYESTNLRASFSPTLSGSFQTFEYSLTSPEMDSISDYTALALEFEVNDRVLVSWAQMSVPSGAIKVFGQAQADILQTYTNNSGQSQTDIKQTYFGHAQCQADIKATSYGSGQCQANIVNTYYPTGQCQANIKAVGYGSGQCQADILNTYFGSGQCQADIKATNNGHGQAQACIVGNAFGQCQADIKQTYFGSGQCQADIKSTYFGHGQCQGYISSSVVKHGQCQAYIKARVSACGQAQAYIPGNAYLVDTFTRTRTFDTGWGTPDVGPTWIHSAPSDDDNTRVNNFAAELNVGDNNTRNVSALSDLNITNFDLFVDIKIETYAARAYSAFDFQVDTSEVFMSNQNEWSVTTGSGTTAQAFTTDPNVWYRIRWQVEGGNARFKIWAVGDSEPIDWLITRTGASTSPGDLLVFFDDGFSAPGENGINYVDNFYVIPFYSGVIQYHQGQAQAFITKSVGSGQSAGAINSAIKQAWGQSQATIFPQYAVVDDSFHRVIYLTDGGTGTQYQELGTPDKGEYLWFFSSDTGVVSFNDRLEYLPYPNVTARELDFGALLDATNGTAFVDFHSDSYGAAFLEIFTTVPDFSEFVDFYYDSGTLNLVAATSSDDTPFTLVDGVTYRMMVFFDSSTGVAKAKMWDASNVEPDWMLEVAITPDSVFGFVEPFLQMEVSDISHETYVTRLWVYSTEVPTHVRSGQARAVIVNNVRRAYGQCQARIKTVGNNKHGQCQAYIRFTGGFGQCQASIVKTSTRSGQCQAFVITPGRANGQAQGTITNTYPNGTAQGLIVVKDINNVGQAQVYIKQTHRPMAQAQGQIRYFGALVSGQCQAKITRTQGYGQAQGMIPGINSGKANAQADIKQVSKVYGQCQAKIRGEVASGQAEAHIKRTSRGSGNAQGYIKFEMAHGQCQARIIRAYNALYGQAQGFILRRFEQTGQTQALIQHRAAYGNTQARIYGVGSRVYGQCQAKILAKAIIQACGQAQAYIRRSSGTGNTQAFIAGGRYLVKYNNYQLPGYAQQESIDSIVSIQAHQAPYQDGSLSEYIGLQNKTLSLRLKAVASDYIGVKNLLQTAATIMTSAKTYTKLYIQQSDRYYEALGSKLTMEKTVGESMRAIDYQVEFAAKPWLTSEQIYTISGTGTITTDTVSRTIYNGGWTPATITVTGTDITVSGYNAAGDFTGFVSVSGTVSSLEIDAVTYRATLAGVNANPIIKNADYAMYVGPGKTTFVVTGASSCVITWRDRWYL